jgi:hypothetical protein
MYPYGLRELLSAGNLMQLIAVMLLTVLYCLVLTNCLPYDEPLDNTLAITNQVMLFVTLLGALMLKFHQGFSSTGVTEEGYDMDVVNFLLLGSVAAVGAVVAVTVTSSAVPLRKGQSQSGAEGGPKRAVLERKNRERLKH